ncbi:MAG: RHS domain-containing protein [Comamonadaceae bacterium]|jgi:uncharacterized protein RhaS with RHS repeats|nr:RHS domain-containing protein [Comamonadaceae bacterium]
MTLECCPPSAWNRVRHGVEYAQNRLQDMSEQLQKQKQEESSPIRIHYYHCDHLGTPLALTDRKHQVVWAVKLDPWGNVELKSPRIPEPIRSRGWGTV